MRFTPSSALIGAAALVLAVGSSTSTDAAFPNKCSAGKEKCVAKKAVGLLYCHAKAEAGGVPVDTVCLEKISDVFDGGSFPASGCFERLEAKYLCYTQDDTGTMEAEVDAFVLDVVSTLDPGYPTPVQNKCSAAKKKCVSKKVAALLGCYQKATAKGQGVDQECIAKVQAKFDGGTTPEKGCFAKIEAKLGPFCLTVDDTAAIEAKVDAFALDVASAVEPLCGNNTVESPFEGCDGTDDAGCPGACRPPGDINECQCPACGDHDVNQASEECDRSDDSACPDKCALDCTCAVCGNNLTEPEVETCDGTDDGACPGLCPAPGAPLECLCPVCGDGVVNQGSEECDGADDGACPGRCSFACTCAVCGNDVTEPGVETCDGPDDAACPGLCLPPTDPNQCRCPVCGDGDVNQASEECDVTDDAACPGDCLSTCLCAVCGNGITEFPAEQCDGDTGFCPESCIAPGNPNECHCPICGDDSVNQPFEQCDGSDDSACPGVCQPAISDLACLCPVCGDGLVNQGSEACDGDDDGACPGSCLPDCTCP